jgi:hypothetical protein
MAYVLNDFFQFDSLYLLVCYVVFYTGVPRLPVIVLSVCFCLHELLFRAAVKGSECAT